MPTGHVAWVTGRGGSVANLALGVGQKGRKQCQHGVRRGKGRREGAAFGMEGGAKGLVWGGSSIIKRAWRKGEHYEEEVTGS